LYRPGITPLGYDGDMKRDIDAPTLEIAPDTLADSPPSGPATMSESWPSSSGSEGREIGGSSLMRYKLGAVLGRGGMGEVLSARDEQIGRSVAIKRLRMKDPSADALARFLREARIQGRLEHPAIVPVHELWRDEHDRPFFVMKQLTGTSLLDVLTKLAQRERDAAGQFPRQRLLRAFADICLAIEFAHTRGVVHRDLKPANIVLGDFGEVYVLDWGIARVSTDPVERQSFADIDTADDGTETVVGSILGTPGYISPEQIRGDADLDGRADVYALGCILYEILANQPLHPRGQAALATALVGIDARPSQRDPEVPPELDAICVSATMVDRGDRFATARQLGDEVQRFLDGDRDIAARKELARVELATARDALRRGNGDDERRIAIRAAARALALDPSDREPADLVGYLMLEPPSRVPEDVVAEIDRLDLEALSKTAWIGTFTALAYLVYFPILYWIGFREPWYMIAGPALCAVIIYVEVVMSRRSPFMSGYVALAANVVMFGVLSYVVSPFVLGAGPSTILIMVLAVHQRMVRTWIVAALGGAATLMPWFLGTIGVTDQTTTTAGNTIVMHTGGASLAQTPALFGLVLYVVVLITLTTVLTRALDNERRDARRSLQIQAWQLRQLIPRPISLPEPMQTPASS
jgi:serine/threonine protein kinase